MQNNTQKQTNPPILLVSVKNTMSFGDDLFRWRKAKGLTQQELAAAAGVNVSYISNLERDFSPSAKGGKPKPSLSLVDKLARVLSVNADEMRLAAGYAPQTTATDTHDILDGVRVSFDEKKLTKAEKETILNAMRMIAAGAKATAPKDE